MRVIYIVGMGRSGSTLLDLMLDSHSQVRSLGGVRRMTNALRTSCACGAPVRAECSFWEAIDAELERDIDGGLENLEVNSRDDAVFRRDNVGLFRAAAKAAGTDYIVDSSKSVSRLKRLLALPELEIYPVHIVRDPCGYVYSQKKRKSQGLVPAFSYVGRSLRSFFLLRNRSHVVVDYGSLADDPERCMHEVMARIGLSLESSQVEWADQLHHNVGGGAVLKKAAGSTVRRDEEWREALSRTQQGIIRAVARPGIAANRMKAKRWGLAAPPAHER